MVTLTETHGKSSNIIIKYCLCFDYCYLNQGDFYFFLIYRKPVTGVLEKIVSNLKPEIFE